MWLKPALESNAIHERRLSIVSKHPEPSRKIQALAKAILASGKRNTIKIMREIGKAAKCLLA
jgi:hypothetical protein